MEVCAGLSLKVATKASIRRKMSKTLDVFIAFLYIAKTEDSATYFLEVGARLSLKVATKGSIRDKKDSEKLYF